jgi:hypothetical protein
MSGNGPIVSTAVALVAGAGQQVATGPGRYCGIVCRDLGAGTVLRVWDNGASTASGTVLDVIVLAAGARTESFTSIYPVQYTQGVFVERVSGTSYEGSVRLV